MLNLENRGQHCVLHCNKFHLSRVLLSSRFAQDRSRSLFWNIMETLPWYAIQRSRPIYDQKWNFCANAKGVSACRQIFNFLFLSQNPRLNSRTPRIHFTGVMLSNNYSNHDVTFSNDIISVIHVVPSRIRVPKTAHPWKQNSHCQQLQRYSHGISGWCAGLIHKTVLLSRHVWGCIFQQGTYRSVYGSALGAFIGVLA